MIDKLSLYYCNIQITFEVDIFFIIFILRIGFYILTHADAITMLDFCSENRVLVCNDKNQLHHANISV